MVARGPSLVVSWSAGSALPRQGFGPPGSLAAPADGEGRVADGRTFRVSSRVRAAAIAKPFPDMLTESPGRPDEYRFRSCSSPSVLYEASAK